jgi:hypothetical protein
MLAREYCDAVGIKLKPVILSHHMLYGLKVRCSGRQGVSQASLAASSIGTAVLF